MTPRPSLIATLLRDRRRMPADRRARLDRNVVSYAAEKDIDALFLPLSQTIGESVRQHAAEGLTTLGYLRIMTDVDAALVAVRGRYPGDRTASLYRLVVDRARQAHALPFAREAQGVRRQLRSEPEVLAAIEREAG